MIHPAGKKFDGAAEIIGLADAENKRACLPSHEHAASDVLRSSQCLDGAGAAVDVDKSSSSNRLCSNQDLLASKKATESALALWQQLCIGQQQHKVCSIASRHMAVPGVRRGSGNSSSKHDCCTAVHHCTDSSSGCQRSVPRSVGDGSDEAGTAAELANNHDGTAEGMSALQRLSSGEQVPSCQCFRVGSFVEANALDGRVRDLQEGHCSNGSIFAAERSNSDVDVDDVEEMVMMQAAGFKATIAAAHVTELQGDAARLTTHGGPESSSAGAQRMSEAGDPVLLLPLLEEDVDVLHPAPEVSSKHQMQHSTWLLSRNHDAAGRLTIAAPAGTALQPKHHMPAANGHDSLSESPAAAASTRLGRDALAVKAAASYNGNGMEKKSPSLSADCSDGVAWLSKTLSCEYSTSDEAELTAPRLVQAAASKLGTCKADKASHFTADTAMLSLKARNGVVAYGSHHSWQMHQAAKQLNAVPSAQIQPTFDAFDEPTVWYHAS